MNQGKSGTTGRQTLGLIGGSYNNRILDDCYQEDSFELDWNIDNATSDIILVVFVHVQMRRIYNMLLSPMSYPKDFSRRSPNYNEVLRRLHLGTSCFTSIKETLVRHNQKHSLLETGTSG